MKEIEVKLIGPGRCPIHVKPEQPIPIFAEFARCILIDGVWKPRPNYIVGCDPVSEPPFAIHSYAPWMDIPTSPDDLKPLNGLLTFKNAITDWIGSQMGCNSAVKGALMGANLSTKEVSNG